MDLDHFIRTYVSESTQHRCFYHFTDKRNLPSIQERQLLSMRNLKAQGIPIPAPGGNQLSISEDLRTGMDGYVHLCMTTGHPMAHIAQQQERIKDIVWLRINPHIIKLPGVLLTNVVSNSAVMAPLQPTDIDKLDLDVVYKWMNWKDDDVRNRLKVAEKYEILIPNFVDLRYIANPNG